ncbi:MAG: CBS domain-containing protein [Euryarchaeota archaeon]|nr:CBS domain-containing protein [Euryarchaeota archaeon]
MKLTSVQREVLLALVDLYQRSKGSAVKGEDIAELIKKNPGTIRNLMQSLRSLGLVEGVPGPKGGYRPTKEAYEALDFEVIEDGVTVPFFVSSGRVEGVSATNINLLSIPDPTRCRAAIHAIGDIRRFNTGDVVTIGPTPVNLMVIKGEVIGRDDMDNTLLIDIIEMVSIPKEQVKNIASRDIKHIHPKATVREAARVLYHELIRGAPVVEDGKPVGIISTVDITRALAEDKEDEPVEKVMSRNLRLINENAYLSQAIDEMQMHNISRLIVVNDKNEAVGLVTRTDIICRIANICKPGF